MDFLGLLLNALPGNYARSLELILGVLAKAKEVYPEEAQQLQWAADQLTDIVSPYLTRQGVVQALNEFVTTVSNPQRWGPPNPGAAAVQ